MLTETKVAQYRFILRDVSSKTNYRLLEETYPFYCYLLLCHQTKQHIY